LPLRIRPGELDLGLDLGSGLRMPGLGVAKTTRCSSTAREDIL
jgi:hypothetical protein